MLFQFSPLIEAGIAAGKYAPVFSSGVLIGLARDAATGQFVGLAQGLLNSAGMPLNPLAWGHEYLKTLPDDEKSQTW